jgi:tetratricopeptide (TPR) repeat protein
MMDMSVEPPSRASVDEILREGKLSFESEDWSRALACFDAVARARPHSNDAHNRRARAYERLGRLEDALECLDRALAIDPRNIADLRNRGVVLRKLGQPSGALASYEALLAIQPDDVNARIKQGLLLNELERREEALASIDQAVRSRPDDLDALNARVLILDNLERYEEALRDADRMLAIQPTHTDAMSNVGMIMARLGRFSEALRCYDHSLSIRPDQPQARYNRSLIRLTLGDWARGFEEFESRWKTQSLKRSRLSGLGPLWLGREDLNGKTLLLYHEQGYGDTLQSVRYIPLLAERGARVILVVPPALGKLLKTVPGVAEVVSGEDSECVHHYHCPLMSLPLAFRTAPDTVPAAVPYLKADPIEAARWRKRLGARTRPRIGLVWGGRRYGPINYPRDIPLERLHPLLELNAEFISLQKEMADCDRALLAQLPQLRPLGEALTDFADTAALIENLDLVIAADTAVAHLAGALGKPVWLMNRYAACWRWLQVRSDSPWYPTMRQFRQPTVGDWDSVVAAVHATAAAEVAPPRAEGSLQAAMVSAPTDGPDKAPREKMRFVCATRLSKEEFFATAPLGRSLPFYRTFPKQQIIELRLFAENRAGLSGLYNTAIEEARSDPAILIFIHDDVYLSDYYWSEHLHRALQSFDLVGLVGNRRRVPGQASWMYLDDRFNCDSYDNFSGVVGHGDPFPNLKQLSIYGEPGAEVKLLDGVLMAIRSRTLVERDLRFDPRFHFHFYDMDFCRQAELLQLKMGTCAVSVVHASAGELGTSGWLSAYRDYLAKYGEI